MGVPLQFLAALQDRDDENDRAGEPDHVGGGAPRAELLEIDNQDPEKPQRRAGEADRQAGIDRSGGLEGGRKEGGIHRGREGGDRDVEELRPARAEDIAAPRALPAADEIVDLARQLQGEEVEADEEAAGGEDAQEQRGLHAEKMVQGRRSESQKSADSL